MSLSPRTRTDEFVDIAACGKFEPHPSHEAALREMPLDAQATVESFGLKRCLNCWMFLRAHQKQPDETVSGWLRKDWCPEDKEINLDHFDEDTYARLCSIGIPASDHNDVYEIGRILYERFSKKDIPVPSKRLIPPCNFHAILHSFEIFYERLFFDPLMNGLFAVGEPGFGRDLGYKEHGRRVGLFCLWRICGDTEYTTYRSSVSSKCPYQLNVYSKLGPSHQSAKVAGGRQIGDRYQFTHTQSRRWLGHQWCAFRGFALNAHKCSVCFSRGQAMNINTCKAIVSWLASIIDLYGPFCDDGRSHSEEPVTPQHITDGGDRAGNATRLFDNEAARQNGYTGALNRQHWEHCDRSNISGAGSCAPTTKGLQNLRDQRGLQHLRGQLGTSGSGPSSGVVCIDNRTPTRERNPPMGTPGRLPFTSPPSGVVLTPRSLAGAGGFGPTWSPGAASPSPRGALQSRRMSPDGSARSFADKLEKVYKQ